MRVILKARDKFREREGVAEGEGEPTFHRKGSLKLAYYLSGHAR